MFPSFLFWTWFLAGASLAQPSSPSIEKLENTWDKLIPQIEQNARHPIALTEQDFVTVSKGKVAKRRIREPGPDRALGMMWTSIDRNQVWIAILDDVHDTLVNALTERRLGHSQAGHKLLYQHLNLPWPVQDRQWVVEIQNNLAIADQSNGMLWERSWDLADPERMPEPDPNAIWVPVSNGSWLLVPIDGGTLVIYHTRSAIGGRIPDEVVTRWAMATLDEMMLHITERAASIPDHYRGNHEILKGGDNIEIKQF